ncbi:primary-amine oxidase [Nostocaceae cyanobacterium CENA357]|uniref:Amine oxidase n=1 Tax=Atlanticothrix silvestris CENA357 TaxID=1725252 RepID=A0A8J7HHW1_9CYAN|nr:primary-amine oxidase [Atlanticothrix silvestris]MBH8552861.1 primary-amine oxidase [Atlanticothrix silvestris CENA357]
MIKRLQFFGLAIAIILCVCFSIGLTGRLSAQQPVISHPLSSLIEAEITTAVSVLKKAKTLSEKAVFPVIALQEPDKNAVINFTSGKLFQRQAFLVVYERSQNKTYEGVVDLQTQKLSSWKEIAGVQPAIVNTEYELANHVVKADPRWRTAMQKRGITDFDQVQISCWAAGILNKQEETRGSRLCRALSYYKGEHLRRAGSERWNYYGSPIEGVLATVNLNTGTVSSFIDQGIVPFSKANWDYDLKSLRKLLSPLKSLRILQPQGASFRINSNEISWQGWKFRYLMHPREGLILYLVNYNDGEKIRPVLYRASLSEMVVPYGDPDPTWSFRNAFDVGEYNFGSLATRMELGKEIPENGLLLDAVLANEQGEPFVRQGIVGIYERDRGMLWKHYEYNTQRNDVRRSRELVMTMTVAIDNYDYSLNWIFHQDGTLEVENELTGIVLAKGTAAQKQSKIDYGQLIAENIIGVNHQHFFNYRLDMDVDGQANSVMEMNVQALPMDEKNPLGNAIAVAETPLAKETTAVRDLDLKHSREWMIVSADQKNTLEAAPGYMLMPGGNATFLPVEGSKIHQKAEFATHHVWVTKYQPDELYAGSDYPNQTQPGQGLPKYISNDESLMGEDIVLWYTMGVTHIPRSEDWPVMPVHRVGFKLVPRGFFPRNPAINLPEPTPVNKPRKS